MNMKIIIMSIKGLGLKITKNIIYMDLIQFQYLIILFTLYVTFLLIFI